MRGILLGMRAYSLDLRERIVAAVREGHSLRTVARRFAVSAASVSRYGSRLERAHTLAPRPVPGARPRLGAATLSALQEHVQQRPDTTVTELHAWLRQEHPAAGTSVSRATVHRALIRAGFTYKKSRWSPPNETRPSAPPGGTP